jgi:aryl sulfotransferase
MNSDMPQCTTTYRDNVFDSSRWEGFAARKDDIIISTPHKCGTTWTQVICGLLIFGHSDFGHIDLVSPVPELISISYKEMLAKLNDQKHRRFIKTHTPLDGLPFYPYCTYLSVYRDPRDVYFSLRSHFSNTKKTKYNFTHLLNNDVSKGFRNWAQSKYVHGESDPLSLDFLVHHYNTFKLYEKLPNIHLFHYADMKRDIAASMRKIAAILKINMPEQKIFDLAEAASFNNMKQNADCFTIYAGTGHWKDDSRFFNKGVNGQWQGVLTDEDLRIYDRSLQALLPSKDIKWLHNGAGYNRSIQ